MSWEHKKYLCIHCKQEFDKIPLERPNECRCGYTHDIIKCSSILKRQRADPFVREQKK